MTLAVSRGQVDRHRKTNLLQSGSVNGTLRKVLGKHQAELILVPRRRLWGQWWEVSRPIILVIILVDMLDLLLRNISKVWQTVSAVARSAVQ